MRFQLNVAKFIAFSVLMFFVAAQSHATPIGIVRGGSNYGPLTTFMSCADGSANNPCEAFGPITTVSFGGTDFTVSQFVFGGPGGPGTVLNLVDLGVLTANQTFTLPPSLFDPAKVEIFACGGGGFDGATAAVDSSGGPISTFCTQNLLSLPPIDQNGASFTTGAAYNFTSHLVLDAPASGPISGTPEPATFMLLAMGLVALGAQSLRNRFRTVASANL
ncbi:MAG TPA: PEP-CTERM sorting domain-containing protein [Candidatus Acidoferrum sp.]|jgi:hypothetical protein